MARRVTQFRYYGNGNKNNSPPPESGITAESFANGDVFNDYFPIYQLGIQTLPGTKFYLNSGRVDPIIIGATGIYELDLTGIAKIDDLRFDPESLKSIVNSNSYLIVDIIYEK